MFASKSGSNLSAANPSVLARSDLESRALAQLKTHNIVLIRAPILAGKTTSLKNISNNLQRNGVDCLWLSIERPLSLYEWIRESFRLLGASMRSEASVSESLRELSRVLNSRSVVLIVDGLDHVEAYNEILRVLWGSLTHSKLLASIDRDEPLDEDVVLDLAVIDLPDFSPQEILRLCQNLGIRMESKNQNHLIEKLWKRTHGKIILVRKVLGWHLSRGVELTPASVEAALEGLSDNFLERVWNSLSNRRREALLRICATEFDRSITNDNLEILGRYSVEILQASGILNSHNGQLLRSDRIFEFAQNKHKDELIRVREALLSELRSGTNIQVCEEWIWQCISLDRSSEAVAGLDRLVESHASKINSANLLKLTNSIYSDISLKAFELRRNALVARDELDQSFLELEHRLNRLDLDQAERAYLYAAGARTKAFLGKFLEAETLLETALELSIESDSKHLFVLASAGRVYQRLDPAKALGYLDVAESVSKKWNDAAKSYLGYIFFSKAYALAQLGRAEKAIRYYMEASEKFHGIGISQMGFLSEFNSLQNLYKWGAVQSCLERVDEVESRLKSVGFSGVRRNLADLKIRLLMDTGRLAEAKRLWLQTFDLVSLGSKDFEPTLKLVEILIQMGDLVGARSFLTSLLGAEFVMSNAGYRDILQKLASIVDRAVLMEAPRFGFRDITASSGAAVQPFQGQILFLTFHLLWSGSWELLEGFEFKDLDKLPLARVEKRSMACLLAWRKLLGSRVDEAGEQFKRLENFFLENRLKVWHLRTQLGLCLIDLIRQQASQAKARLRSLYEQIDGIDSQMDLYLFDLVKRIADLKVMNLESLENITWMNVDNFKKEDESMRVKFGLTSCQQRFSDHLLELTNIGSPRKVIIRTRSEEAIVEERAFDRKSLSHFDLVYDERDQVLFVRNQIVSVAGRGVLNALIRLLFQNYDAELSKESLALIVWKEVYHPLIHDNRIYTSIKRLRQLITPKLGADFVDVREGAYSLKQTLSFAWICNHETRVRFSDQQMLLLSQLQSSRSMSRQDIQKLFRGSRTQTLRELKPLLDQGSLESYGSGRAVRYRLSSNGINSLHGHGE